MKPEEARKHLLNLLGEKLVFNDAFDSKFTLLKEKMQNDLLEWCFHCKEGTAKGSVPDNPLYKDRFVFFRKIGGNIRCAFVKLKNADFIEIHLITHKEYDDLRLRWGYKKSSYYWS